MPDALIPANLTPEEQAEFDAKSPVAPAAPAQGQSVLSALSAPELAELAVKDKDNFDLIHEFRNNQDLWQDPAVVQKVADAHNLIRQRGFKFSDLPGPAKIAGQVYDVGKGLAKQAWNYAGAGLNAAMGVVAPAGIEEELTKQAQQKVAENFSGSEQAVTGLANMAEKGVNKVFGKNPAQLTPEEKLQDLWTAVGKGETEQDISRGHGAFMQGVGGHVISDLEKQGAGVRPEEVAQLTPGDPFSFWAFGKAMGTGGKVVSAVTPNVVKAGLAKAGEAISESAGKFTGQGIEKAGQALQVGAKVTGKVGQTVLPVAGAIEGAIKGGPIGVLPGIAGGQVAAKALTKTAAGVEKAGASVEGVGQQVSGAKPMVSPYAQAIKDTAEATPGAVADVAKGAATDIGVAAVTSENPHDTEGVGLGAAIGALHGGARLGTHLVSGQIIAPRAWGSSSVTSSSGAFPKLDSMHSDAIASADPGVKTRLNAIREFAKRTGTDVFLAKDAPSLQSALEASGVEPERAAQMADQEGFFTAQLPDKNGQPKRVIVAKNIEAAPHESFHAIQDVLGESANREIDDIVKKAYANEWDNEGQKYAARLGGKGDWRETILDLSGWGRSEAAEKLLRDTGDKDQATAEWNQKIADAQKLNPSATPEELQAKVWRDILTLEEASATADRYLARELAAENFDMVFKHGPQGKSLPERLARIVANLTTTMGGNPLSDRRSAIGQITPKFSVTEAVRKAQPGELPKTAPVVTPKSPKPAAPVTPTVPTAPTEAAEEAKKLAEEAPETLPGRTTSPREVLGTVAEAIAQQTGVKVNYHSAPGEPAAATTSNREQRRTIIEAFRDMPKAARALWEKTFFPERVIKTKNDYQIMGWAPEVFAANAHKLAQTLAEVNPKLSPYEIDPEFHTFTDAGWQDLYKDVQRFVKNQMAGSTGSGKPLVVPKSVTEKGAYAPATKPGAEGLDQKRADFINMLFNFRLPDSPRVQKGKLPLNVIGQEVSEATEPGRTAIPVRPRGMFTGKEADALGIAGRDIKEVNPLRQQIEQEAQAAGKALPSMIEAIQKLNLENIADVQLAPEAPQFRGNTLTLTAGFQPPSAEVKKSGKEYVEKAAIRLKDGKIFTGAAHYQAVDEAVGKKLLAYEDENLADKYTDGFMTNAGRFVDREEAAKIAQSVGQLADHSESVQTRPKSLEAHLFNSERQFQPPAAEHAMDDLKDPEKWKAIVSHPAGKYGGGLTGWAFEQGANAKQEDLAKFKSAYEMFSDLAKDTIKTGDFEKGMDLMSRAQVAHEAYQMATGKDLQGNDRMTVIRKMIKDPEFQPPLGESTRKTLPSEGLDKGQDTGHNSSMIQAQPVKANDDVHEVAVQYAKSKGLDYAPARTYAPVNEDLLKRVADHYDAAKSDPKDEQVKASYKALASEVLDQYHAMVRAGYEVQPWTGKGEPYKNSTDMVRDVAANKHLFYKPTESSFGQTEGEKSVSENPMLADSGIEIDGKTVPVNDIFRAVHDFFGHAKEGYQFGPRGEFNAWKAHSEMFTPEAQGALAGETLAQNAWVNFGPQVRGKDIPLAERQFAEQKNISLPQNFIDEARGIQAQAQPKKAANKEYDSEPERSFDSTAWAQKSGRQLSNGKEMVGAHWLFRDGKAVDVEGAMYHDDTATEMLEITSPEKGKPSEEFQYDTGAIRVAIVNNSPKAVADYGNGQLAISLSKKPSGAQLKALTESLKQTTVHYGESIPLYDKVSVDVHDSTGKVIAGQIFDWPTDQGKFMRFLRNPEPAPGLSENAIARLHARMSLPKAGEVTDYKAADKELKEFKILSADGHLDQERAKEFLSQAQPKKADDWQMPDKASNGFKKAWITPDGEPIQLGGQWHHDWLAQHPEYGIKVSDVPSMDEDARVEALGKGFVRLNYGQNSGTLVVEARAKDWPKQRDNVRQFVEANLGDIDNLKIALTDPKAESVIDSNTVKLFNYDDAQKIENVPLLNESAPTARKEIPVAEAAALRPDKSYNPSDSYFQAQPKKPTDQLPGFEKPEAFSSKEISDMTKDELKAHFPEAIVPKKRTDSIPSDIVGSPLFKQSGSEEKAVDAFAKKMVDFAKQWEGHPVYDMGKQWYSEFAPMLKKQFGADAPLMAELLAATSPQTSVETNFGYAHDALESIKSGRFDKLIKKFEQGLSMLEDDRWLGWYNKELNAGNIPEPPANPTEAAFLEAWINKHDLKPRQSNGKLYGQHSLPVLQVFARRWLDLAKGPKTRNFVENLLGNGHEATIDLWADRTMRRLGYEDSQQRWRILPQNKAGVSDADFAFAQKVYRKAADELKMNPDDLQGALWFAEKQLWADNGWGRLDLGDFRKEMEKVPMLRQGYKQRLQISGAKANAKAEQQLEILPRNVQ
jgi:hypothetical protein